MRLAGAMLADEARITSGLLSISGGGWRYVERPSFPTTLIGAVAGVIELELDSLGSAPVLRVTVKNSGGQEPLSLGSIVIDAFATDGMPMRAAFCVPFSIAIPAPGPLDFEIAADGFGVLGSVPLPIVATSTPDYPQGV